MFCVVEKGTPGNLFICYETRYLLIPGPYLLLVRNCPGIAGETHIQALGESALLPSLHRQFTAHIFANRNGYD